MFAALVFFAFRARSNPAAHKRLILVATTALLLAAIARWPHAVVHRKPMMAALASYIFLLILIAYDLWSARMVHLGWRVPHLRPTDKNTNRQNCRVAHRCPNNKNGL